ncbi:MAG: Calx-beta domain-containing protein, partial [Verrucomicrobiota bacterium]
GNGTVQEGGPGEKKVVNFTVTLSAVSSEAVTVKYVTMDGTATVANGDYTASGSQTLTFAPGETTKTISVEVNGDATVELDEAFKVQLSNATQATLGTSVGTATILNDDGATVVIRNNGTPVVVTEGSGPNATRFAQFVVELADAGDAPVTVTYSTVDGTAKSADGDFTAVTNQTLTFAAGETSKLVSIPILADAFGEGTENFTIKLNSATNASLVTGRDTITATILDDEPTISVGDVTVIEGSNGTSSAVFTVKLNKAATGNVVVNYQTEDGTAVDGMVVEGGAAEPAADYTRSLGSITFLPGQTTQTITVPVTADMALEGSETFRLKLTLAADSEARLADGEAVATIKESTLSVGAVTVVEGSGGVKQAVFTVKLSDPLGSAVSVAYNTEDGTAAGGSDFTAVTGGSLTFAPGETEKTVSIPILGDLAHEASETFKLKLSGASAGLGTAEALGTITDDDPVPRISIDNQAVLEGSPDGVRQAEFTLRLSAASSETITVLVATKDGTATTVDNDYVGKTQTVTFAPGELTQKFVVDVISDTRGEADEAFTLNLSAPTNATLGAASQATGTITNDDLSLSITSPGTVIEGGTGSFTVRLSGPSTESVTVNYPTQSGTAAEGVDYETAKGTVVFAPGETVKTIDVKSKADTGSEANETFVVLLSNALNAGISVDKATASITDQKALLSIGDVSIVEGDSGELIQTFTVTRSGGDLSAATTVDWATGDGTAKDGVNEAFADYEAASGTLTFAAGETSKTFTVKIKGDILKEGNEAFQVSLSNAQNASIVKGVATATIVEEAGDNAMAGAMSNTPFLS